MENNIKTKKHLPLGEADTGLSIVKIGGNIIESKENLATFLNLFSKIESPKILVHGGGKKANQVLKQMHIAPKMVNGRRVTDAATLDIAVMVYGGLLNKNITAQLQALNCNAIGMSGTDGNTISAVKRPVKEIDYGFVGDITSVNTNTITTLLKAGLTPVFCALSHDKKGQLLNTNADTIASALSVGLSENYNTTLNYCFELDGVLKDINDKSSLIKKINSASYATLISDGVLADGMLPKMHNCFEALKQGVAEVRIGNMGLFKKESTNYTTLVL